MKSAEAIADTLQARGPVRHPDEYEILYMRGGSPPPPPPEQLQQHDEPDQARGDSYSSHEERRRRHKKDRRERVKRRLLKKVESVSPYDKRFLAFAYRISLQSIQSLFDR